ncbi:hypothetical protein RB623_28030 [Mesorhizobium sp. LHD-90]|uniref:hypothetical protein n=1 Tax=Mesorhizobium sp. LHD-90 TaxID=3071414 RepID=UPI0027E070EC|nr:hypothetical protein [Mesorhizobium sp. LHD-90]MDQ6437919.1 hypothetical protein [Mesorhizobium sp. LHD-90]
MRALLTLTGLLAIVIGLSACQSASSSSDFQPRCTPRAQDAGSCYGIALPAGANFN